MSLYVDWFRKFVRLFKNEQGRTPVNIDDIEFILDKLQLKEQGLLLALSETDSLEEVENLKRDLEILHAHQRKGRDVVNKLTEEDSR